MLVTKLLKSTSIRSFNKFNVTMSQKSLLSFFQKKSSDDPTRTPLQENTVSEKSPKSPLKALVGQKRSKKEETEEAPKDTVTEKSPKSPLKASVGQKRSKKEETEEAPKDTVTEKSPKSPLKASVGQKRSKKEETEEAPKDTVPEKSPKSPSKASVGKKRSKKEKTEEAPKKSKNESSKKRKRSEEREVVEEADEKPVEKTVSPKSQPEKMETGELECATNSVDAKKLEPTTPVLRTLSYLGSKKLAKKPKSKTPAKKKSNESPKENNIAKKSKIEEENQSTETDKPKDSKADVDGEKETENSKSEVINEKPKVAAFLNTKKEDSSETISYNPAAERYDPIKDACWEQGQRVPYLALAKTLQKIEETSARLKIISILSNYFRSVIVLTKEDLLPSIYLCLNQLGPAYDTQELGIADTYLMKAIAQCTGRSLAHIKADAAEIGDLGIVAEQSRTNQRIMFRPSSLTVRSVFQQLTDLANITGNSAVNKKIDKIQGLFVSCKDCEARFVIRSLAGKLRIGLAEQSVIQALALALTTTPPCDEFPPEVLDTSKKISSDEFKKKADADLLILKSTYSECPNFNLIVPVILEKGLHALPEHCKITPGIPVKPMLAQPTKGVQEVLQRFEGMKFTCEWKYDGERAQIHILEDKKIKLFSRNMEDNTSKYPDIIADIRQFIKPEVKSCILDAEAVAWDQEKQKIMPFQILSTRKRKAADINEIKVHVCVYLFDLLYLNGESFFQKPLIERREALQENFNMVDNKFALVKSLDTNTMEEVEEFLEESVKGNCEGLMIKTLDVEATYEIAKRSRNWLKLKKDYLDGCGDTLDLVVIGGYIGKGKRTGQYGGFLLASYDAESEEYQTICKIGTGFSEEALAKHTESLKELIIPKAKPYYRYDTSHEPDFWFDAVQVWEVKCADLSLSPIYYSGIGLVDPEKGISLRFPRFLRIREDKSAEQATSSGQVADLYKNQDQIKNQAGSAEKFNEEDF